MKTYPLSKLRNIAQVIIVLCVACSLFSCTGEPECEDTHGDNYACTKEWVTQYINNELITKGNVPSVLIALVDDQDVVWQKAFGYANLEEQKSATADTIYRMASISKPLTALAIMKLYEEGIIDIDAPITDYLPDFSIKTRFPDSDPITIRSIMAHRAGLPQYSNRRGEQVLEDFERITLEEIVDSLQNQYVSYPVGYRFKYSNLGFTLLGRIIEVVTERNFVDYMQDNIYNPLGMSNSAFLSSPEMKERMAKGYDVTELPPKIIPQTDISDLPCANMYSTLKDMTSFIRLLLQEGKINGSQFINKETLEMMYVDYYSKPRDPTTYGLPWKLLTLSTGHLMIAHGGSVPGFFAVMGVLPNEKLGFVIMANAHGALNPLALKLPELMLESKFGIKPEKNTPEAVDVDRTTLEQYAGKYGSNGGIIEINLKNNTLQLIEPSGIKANLIPITERKFKLSMSPLIGLILEPILGQGTVEFFVGDENEGDILILDFQLMPFPSYCPRLPKVEEIPPLWPELKGKYTIEPYFNEEVIGELQIDIINKVLIEDKVLIANWTGVNNFTSVLNPISATEILMVGSYEDGDTIFYDSNTGYLSWSGIIAKPFCPATLALGENSNDLNILREFRDKVLSKTPEGQEIIKQYYELSPVIVKAMEEDKDFKKEVKEMIKAVLQMVKPIMN